MSDAHSTILVEARADPRVEPTLDAIAESCRLAGYSVVRWHGPFSGRVRYSTSLVRCRAAVLWNATHPRYAQAVRLLRRWGVPIVYVELGWFPQDGSFQLDWQGINANASWVHESLKESGGECLEVRPNGDLLVLLQNDKDTQILVNSPWFGNMRQFVEHMIGNSALPLRFRPHPLHRVPDDTAAIIKAAGLSLDCSTTLEAALTNCRAVATINSSAGVAALAHGVPVLCYGEAIYRKEHAVYCMQADPGQTQRVTSSLAAGRCTLWTKSARELLERIRAQQWTIAELPQRLPPFLRHYSHASNNKPSRNTRQISEPMLRLPKPLPDEANGSEVLLGVVIPYRGRFETLEIFLKNIVQHEQIVWCVVNLGDSDSRVESLCRRHSVRHEFVQHDGVFQIGACMNHGARRLACRFFLTQDVDCLAPPGFYERLLVCIKVLDADPNPAAFLMLGCYYASAEFSHKYLNGRIGTQIHETLLNTPHNLEAVGFTGTIPVVRRRFFLNIGGIDERFKGHGAEDFYLLHQLSREWGDIERPPGYPGTGKEAAGLRVLAGLYRQRSRDLDLFLIHRFHARPARQDAYREHSDQNWRLLYQLIEAWDKRKVLVETHPMIFPGLRHAFTGEVISPLPANNPHALKRYLAEHDVRCLLLGNLKAHDRGVLADVARASGVPAYCVERGPLEDTMFLDPNGFNAESSSYARSKWDRPLTDEQSACIARYMERCRGLELALERQEPRESIAAIRKKYGLSTTDRVLFVPLQSPGDTVVRLWSDWIENMNAFAALADQIAQRTSWRVLVKRHPIDKTHYHLQSATLVSSHFKDLLEVSDAVLTINSGMGVQALLWDKPTLVAGHAFYQFDELNCKVNSLEDILCCLSSPMPPLREAALRFLYFLKFRFCCDVSFERTEIELREGRTGNVHYHDIRHVYPDWMF